MFSEISKPEPTLLERGLAFLRKAFRNRVVRIGAGIFLGALGLAALSVAWAVDAAKPAACISLDKAELTLQEIISVKRQVDAHQEDAVDHMLRFNGREATFILAEHFEYPVWVSVHDHKLEARLALPDNGYCYNIEFQGHVEIEEGIASVVPSHLLIGRLDLSTLLNGHQFILDAQTERADGMSHLLRHIHHLAVEEDHIVLQLDDVASLQ